MKIAVLDGITLNPGDLSWDDLNAIGSCKVYDGTPPEQVVERSKDAEILVINKIVLKDETFAQLDALRYVGVTATGYNVVDVAAARKRNIVVTNVPVYGTQSVAQMVFALLLELTQHVGHHSQTVRQGRWSNCDSFCYWDFPLIELAGLTLGIVGYGRIGKATAILAKAFGMNVLAYDVLPEQITDGIAQAADLDRLFAESDVISLHSPLTPQNEGMINAERISQMKNSALLINTSRGQLIKDQELAQALNNAQIAGAGLDVLSVEPPLADNPLFTAKNCYITPHIAWATRSARQRLMTTTVENLKAFLAGKPKNVVS